jgi:hypothetical protein
MKPEDMGKLLDEWEQDWADRRFERIARVDLVRRIAAALGREMPSKIDPKELLTGHPRLAAFLKKWDSVFAEHRVDFVVDLSELLIYEGAELLGSLLKKLRMSVKEGSC